MKIKKLATLVLTGAMALSIDTQTFASNNAQEFFDGVNNTFKGENELSWVNGDYNAGWEIFHVTNVENNHITKKHLKKFKSAYYNANGNATNVEVESFDKHTNDLYVRVNFVSTPDTSIPEGDIKNPSDDINQSLQNYGVTNVSIDNEKLIIEFTRYTYHKEIEPIVENALGKNINYIQAYEAPNYYKIEYEINVDTFELMKKYCQENFGIELKYYYYNSGYGSDLTLQFTTPEAINIITDNPYNYDKFIQGFKGIYGKEPLNTSHSASNGDWITLYFN
jgi:hypothetical protein